VKKRTTIFRQLIVSVLLPVVILISFLSYYNFLEKKEQIDENRKETIQLIQTEIGDLLTFFDLTLFEIEKEMSNNGEYFANILVNDIFPQTTKILDLNLDSLRYAIGMDTTQDIYIIDLNGVIVNTSYPPDLGLDFYAMSDYFIGHFENIRKEKGFVADRISIEMSTNLPKKYMYQTTHNNLYIIELGFYSDPAKNLVNYFTKKVNAMPQKYKGIDTVSLFFGTSGFASYQKHIMPKRDSIIGLETLNSGKSNRSSYQLNNLLYTSEYSYISMESSILHKGYLIRIVHNNAMLQALNQAELVKFIINLLLFGLPIFLLILWRARVLSKPISSLVEKMDLIQSGNLTERVNVIGNNEVTDLGEHFNSMISELQESYATLEQKVKDRTNQLFEQKHIIEEKHKEITDSINYAERIQRSFLATKEQLDENLADYFVFFKPKDVVSGDFYWASSVKTSDANGENNVGNSFCICCADSTGHGVPGAIMSILNISSLEKAIETETEPHQILNATRKIIIDRLKKDGSLEGGKDGMDCTLLMFNKEKTMLHFSAANNPLFIVRETPPTLPIGEDKGGVLGEVDLIEFKADKMPVGKHDRYQESFTLKTVELQKGDCIYTLTDGFPDQFGGEKGKKYMIKNLKEYIRSISHLPMQEQQTLLNYEFEQWKGVNEQIDDVCIIGIRI
jgi:serine phosphatase RsbU (regulator of sigma subunit)